MATEARRVALAVLRQMQPGGLTLADRLAQADVARLDPRDRAFLHELVLGTLRARGRLDHALAACCNRPLAEMEPAVLDVLRLGAYQVLELRVADRAAVAESVDLARSVFPPATGFVNAVLRRIASRGHPPLPDPASDPRGWLTTAGSLPPWLAERYLAALGPERAIARAQAFAAPAPRTVRLNPRRPGVLDELKARGIAARSLPVPGAWELDNVPMDLLEKGALSAQDAGSQLVAHLAAGPGLRLDACAAPGGKTLLMADLGESGSRIVALEISARRTRLLAALVRRWGAANVAVLRADATQPPFLGTFDGVLLDAPCSGLGTLGRHPDARWRVQPDDLLRHQARQRSLLDAMAPLVRAGGTIVYSTCSLEPEETDDVVRPFLDAHPEIGLEAPPAVAAEHVEDGVVRVLPERTGGDGFFAACLRRAS